MDAVVISTTVNSIFRRPRRYFRGDRDTLEKLNVMIGKKP